MKPASRPTSAAKLTGDPAAALSIAAAAEASDGMAPLDEATLMALRDGSADLAMVEGGFTLHHDGSLDLVVHPDRRGEGLGGSLLTSAEEAYDGPLAAWSHGNHPAAARLAERHGWERVRDLWVMRRRMSEPLPALRIPSGVRIRSWRDGDADAVVAINAAAFASHPEQGAMDHANLARRMAEPWFDPAGLLLVEDDSGVLGFHWTKRHSRTLGEVYVVGVAPSAQGRGLGRLLTLAGLHQLADRRVSEVLLYVESDNAAAIATYTRLGFTHADSDTHVQYRRRA